MAKIGVFGQNQDFGPKKNVHFLILTMFWPRPEKVVQRKKLPFPNFGFFGLKTHFCPENYFSAERKNGRFSIILARTESVFILGNFYMARTFPPSFVENGPKLNVLVIVKWEWPKTAKNRCEPRKMTNSSETEFCLGLVRMGKL